MGVIHFYPVNDQRPTAIKKGYTLRPLRLSTIDEHELARHVEADSGIDHARVEYIMASVVKQLREMVLNGHKVELSELGVIGLTCRARGSDTEQQVSVHNNVKTLQFTFRPSATLREQLGKVRCQLTDKLPKGRHLVDQHGAKLLKNKSDSPETT